MRTGLKLLILAGVTATAALPIAARPQAALQDAARAEAPVAVAALPKTQALAKDYVAQNRVPGIVMAIGIEERAPVFIAEGRIAVEPTAPAADADTLWRIYSMTKPITGIAAMILIDDGKLRLDQPISDLIPAFRDMKVLVDPATGLESRPAARPITVRHLLTHTAGLGYNIITKGPLLNEYNRLGINPAAINTGMEMAARGVRPKSLEEFANRVATLPLIADPGTKWSYSISLDVLARVIEVASGMPYEQFLQTRLFTPLGMRSTFFTVPASEFGRFATNYYWAADNRIVLDPGNATSVFASPPSFPYGGAGLVSSARDYDRFLHMLMNEGTLDGATILKPETARLAMSNLLPEGVSFSGAPAGTGGTQVAMGFGAGGSVTLQAVPGGPGKGTYGWGGAASTIAYVDRENGVRGTIMVNYIPSEKWPLRADVSRAVYADIAR